MRNILTSKRTLLQDLNKYSPDEKDNDYNSDDDEEEIN